MHIYISFQLIGSHFLGYQTGKREQIHRDETRNQDDEQQSREHVETKKSHTEQDQNDSENSDKKSYFSMFEDAGNYSFTEDVLVGFSSSQTFEDAVSSLSQGPNGECSFLCNKQHKKG